MQQKRLIKTDSDSSRIEIITGEKVQSLLSRNTKDEGARAKGLCHNIQQEISKLFREQNIIITETKSFVKRLKKQV